MCEELENLLPCPFCGHDAIYLDETSKDDCRTVFCRNRNCGAKIRFKRHVITKEDIIKAWNLRQK